jgi:hypothetical protein
MRKLLLKINSVLFFIQSPKIVDSAIFKLILTFVGSKCCVQKDNLQGIFSFFGKENVTTRIVYFKRWIVVFS